MTQEDKNLIFKELCARIPYGVKVQTQGWDEEKGEEVTVALKVYSINTDGYLYVDDNDFDLNYCSIEDCQMYLRPMSSMSEDETEEFLDLIITIDDGNAVVEESKINKYITFLYSHHFDVNCLIDKGLALEAPKDIYTK